MAGEVQVSFSHGATLYFLVWSRTGQIWNTGTSAFEAYSTANYANYVISLLELGTASHKYNGTFPAAIPAGVYQLEARQQPGGSPLETDPTIGVESEFQWNGSAAFPLSDLITSGGGGAGPARLAQGVAVSGFMFPLVSAADHVTPFTSGVVSGQVSRNGGAFGPLQSGAFSEVGLGFYSVPLTSGDVAAENVALVFTATGISGGNSDPRMFSLIMQRVSGNL